ncbi:hypothetical protein BZL30_4506 [Mycobacterium kansasii]|uniref:TNT domain-containing protein n=1 Tax=Mycobacterium kansasii TaxID=1768 RepID=A0A1V3X4X6_MYCKA|nr:hypothetical protein BZL30_4506 [Mycobacterium kansasii]
MTKFYGRQFDRIGNVDGKYLAIMVDGVPASWEARALHINSLREPYNAYEFDHLPTGWHVEVSEVAPGVGQPGGRYRFGYSTVKVGAQRGRIA